MTSDKKICVCHLCLTFSLFSLLFVSLVQFVANISSSHSALSPQHLALPPHLQIVQNVFFAPGDLKTAISPPFKTSKMYILYRT